MLEFKIKSLLEQNHMSRYKFQQLTHWNQKRINAFYFGTALTITVTELETMCKIFNCKVEDLIEVK